MEKKKLYIYASISFAITSILIYFLLKGKDGLKALARKESTNYEKSSYRGLIVSTPNNNTSFDVLIVFGGISYANPEWMYKQLPREVLLNNLVFIAPYTEALSSVKDKVASYMDENGFKEVSLSLVGFSAGGLNIQSGYSINLKFFGLIDPSTKSEYAKINYGKNAHMVYNNDNWGAYPNIKSLQPKIAKNIENGGGMTEEVKMAHADIPKYFFSSHSKYLRRKG